MKDIVVNESKLQVQRPWATCYLANSRTTKGDHARHSKKEDGEGHQMP